MGEIENNSNTAEEPATTDVDAPATAGLPPNIEETESSNSPELQTLADSSSAGRESDIGLVTDIPLELTVELGRTQKSIKEILNIGIGTVIELDKIAGEHVNLLANGKLLAKGEVVVVEDNFAIKITDIINNKTNPQNDK